MFSNDMTITKHVNDYYYFLGGEFFLTIGWFAQKTGLTEEDIISMLVNVYNGEHSLYYMRFKYKEDAVSALEWLESVMLMKELRGMR